MYLSRLASIRATHQTIRTQLKLIADLFVSISVSALASELSPKKFHIR